MKKLACIISLIVITGCISAKTVHVPVSSTIPPRMQQQVNTTTNQSITFQFQGTPKAKHILVKSGKLKNTYSINEPFHELFKDLVKTKFQDITPKSKNKINVNVTDFKTITKRDMQIIKMDILVQLRKGKQKDKRKISYKTSIGYNYDIGSYKFIQSGPINNFLQKFIVSTDKYIDTFYGIN